MKKTLFLCLLSGLFSLTALADCGDQYGKVTVTNNSTMPLTEANTFYWTSNFYTWPESTTGVLAPTQSQVFCNTEKLRPNKNATVTMSVNGGSLTVTIGNDAGIRDNSYVANVAYTPNNNSPYTYTVTHDAHDVYVKLNNNNRKK